MTLSPKVRVEARLSELTWHNTSGFDHPLPPDRGFAPTNVWIEDDHVRWEPRSSRRVDFTPTSLVEPVLALRDSPAHDVVAFVKEHGALAVCDEHNLPLSHSNVYSPDESVSACDIKGGREAPSTPLSWYTSILPSFVEGVIRVATALWEASVAENEAWALVDQSLAIALEGETAIGTDWARRELTPMDKVEEQRETLGQVLDGWLRMAGVGLHLEWAPEDDRPAFSLVTGTVLGRLLLGLTEAVTGQGLTFCYSCNAIFTTDNKPIAGTRHYCRECGRKAQLRDAKRRQREKKLRERGAKRG